MVFIVACSERKLDKQLLSFLIILQHCFAI